jgi:uncharacterized protein YegL
MKAIRGWELRKGIHDAVHKICSALGLKPVRIIWDADITTACINAKGTIRLADIKDDAVIPHKVFMRYLGFVVHELLHRKYTRFGVTYKNKFVSMLANALEDARIEHLGIKAELTGNIQQVLTVLIDEMVEKALAEVENWNDSRQLPFVLAVYMRDHAKTKVPVNSDVLPIFEEAKVRLTTCRNSADVGVLAQWIYDQLISDDEEKEDEEPTEKGDGEGEEKGEGEAEGENKGEGEGEEKGEGGKSDEPMSPINPDDAVNPEPQLDIEKGISGGVSWNPDACVAKDMEHFDKDRHPMNVDVVGGAKLRYEVKRLFEMSGLDEYQHNRRSGILDVGALHTLSTGNDRVFKRHIEEGGIDSAVVFLLDCSGSMFEDRIRVAVRVLASMLDTLDRAGVATSIVTFGTQVSMFKPWGMPKRTAIENLRYIDNGSHNCDHQALRYCHQLLLNRTEQRKVVFSLCDGGVDRYMATACTEQNKSAERLGITTIGVGIQEDISRIYPNHITIKNLDELGTASFKQIKLAA